MEPVKITENIYWVGALDYSIRDFHGYKTSDGSTYNSYLIVDDKITLIDAVKDGFLPELLSRVSKIVDPKKIDLVVSNHAEMDHSGSLPALMQYIGAEKPVITSKMGEKALRGQFRDAELNLKPVASNEVISLGQKHLEFLETRMVHWPDSMFTYCPEVGMLCSQDGFGMHLATSRRFNDEVGRNVWSYEALKYFANILTPYTSQIQKAIEMLEQNGIADKIKFLCPDHGLIWRKNVGEILGLYKQWVKQEPFRKAVVVYDTMWHSTEKMALVMADALAQHNVYVKLMSMKTSHRSDIVTEVFNSGAVLVGSPTINNEIYPTIAELLTYMKGLKFKNKISGVFGSYGWSGEATKNLQQILIDMKYNMIGPDFKFQWVPEESDLQPIRDMAKAVADALPQTPLPVTCGL